MPDDRVLLTEEAPVFIRILRTERRSAPLPDNLQRDPELEAVARHEREPFFDDRTIDGTRVRVRFDTVGDGLAVFAARPLTEVDHALGTLRWALGVLALAGIALAVFLSRLATRTAIRPVAELTETAEHVASTRDLSRRIDDRGRGRGLAPGELVQHDARGARALAARPAPARRRRLARAAHAADLAAHQPRGARARRRAGGRRPRAAQIRPGGAARGADGARRRPRRARPRRRAGGARERGPPARPAGRGRGRACATARAERALRDPARARARAGRPGAAGPRGQRTCSTTRRSSARRARSSTSGSQRRRADRARPRARDRGRRPRAGLRPLLPRRRRARAAGLRARAGDRAPGGRGPRRDRRRGGAPRAAARCCACGSRSSQQIPRFG